MLLPTQDDKLLEESAKALRARYMSYGRSPLVASWEDTPFKEYWKTLTKVVLKIVEKEGYCKGLPPSIEEALNSGDGAYRP